MEKTNIDDQEKNEKKPFFTVPCDLPNIMFYVVLLIVVILLCYYFYFCSSKNNVIDTCSPIMEVDNTQNVILNNNIEPNHSINIPEISCKLENINNNIPEISCKLENTNNNIPEISCKLDK
jgi:hypothetical protein